MLTSLSENQNDSKQMKAIAVAGWLRQARTTATLAARHGDGREGSFGPVRHGLTAIAAAAAARVTSYEAVVHCRELRRHGPRGNRSPQSRKSKPPNIDAITFVMYSELAVAVVRKMAARAAREIFPSMSSSPMSRSARIQVSAEKVSNPDFVECALLPQYSFCFVKSTLIPGSHSCACTGLVSRASLSC